MLVSVTNTVFLFQINMLRNEFAEQVVADYVKQQVENSNCGADLLVCAGSSATSMMSKAVVSMWSPAFKIIDSLADPANPPDALILPDLSAAGLLSLKEYIYTGETSTPPTHGDASIIQGGTLCTFFVDVILEVEQLHEGGDAGEEQADTLGQADDTTTTSTGNDQTKQVSLLLFKCIFFLFKAHVLVAGTWVSLWYPAVLLQHKSPPTATTPQGYIKLPSVSLKREIVHTPVPNLRTFIVQAAR